MTQAFPSPATQKTNGAVDKGNERDLGMSYRQWLMGKILEGSGASLVALKSEDLELLVARVLWISEALSPE